MVEVEQTEQFERWMGKLKDRRAAARISSRIDRLRFGNPGTVKPIGEGVSELKVDYGPGYRVYLKSRGEKLVVLLCGGNKSTQAADIKKAKELASKL